MQKITKRLVIFCILTVFLSLFTSCASSGVKTENGLKVVKVAFDDAPSEAGIILGDKLGFFEKQGIKIEYVKFNSGADELTSISTNQVSVSRGIINAGLFNAVNQGIGIKLVADGGHNIPGKGYFQIALKKGLGEKYKDYKDMKGMRIAIASTGSINELFAEKALEKGGLTKNDVQYVIVDSFPDMLTAVANGNADATVQIEPLITQGVSQGILEWWKDPDEYAKDEEISVLMYSPQFAKDKELGKKFMIGYLQGVRAYNDAFITGKVDQDKIINILCNTTFVNKPEIFLNMNPPGLDPNGHVLKDGVIEDQKFYMNHGLVKTEANVDNIVDDSYVQEALKVLGEYKK
ncbi:MAG: ABC transporter substrate-binding protein [Bacillota bacterium]|nr:ABC transporter substrate-binding protein [Bacillota bacterium]